MLSVIESTLDDPRPVLSQQQFKARGEAVAAMKSEGIEYEERMELLEEVTWPKPLEELLEADVRDVRQRRSRGCATSSSHRSRVVRDLYERAMTLRGVRRVLPARAQRGSRAALPERRVSGGAADDPG